MRVYVINSFIILCLIGCNGSSIRSLDDYSPTSEEAEFYEYSQSQIYRFLNPNHLEGDVNYKLGGKEFIVKWSAFRSDSCPITFSLPKDWTIKESKGNKVKSWLPNEHGLFTFLIHEKKDYEGIDVDDYLAILNHDLKTDTLQNFQFLRQEKLPLNKHNGYLVEVSNEHEENKELYLIIISESDKFIFDFTLKMTNDGIDEINRASFFPVIFSFKIGDSPIISMGESTYTVE